MNKNKKIRNYYLNERMANWPNLIIDDYILDKWANDGQYKRNNNEEDF